ncbi:anthranilate phosphoribosyltransferase [Clostridium sediminicola]|uniref:anthranilate phosphoribosyltransferase n=1 Tax=Clostridium sediminicola TaxID=3114879 RepID=UPI0031F1D417
MFKEALDKVVEKKNLTVKEMMMSFEEIMEGKVEECLVASFLTALKLKGETIDEITGGAMAMINKAEKLQLLETNTLDTCGTGGDKRGTYNISTASAFICAAAGIPVVKHGNRSVSSKSGSADVLEELGVNIMLKPEEVKTSIEETSIGFLFAPTFHKAMKYAGPVRKKLGFKTVFNILGPLTNPARARYQVLGVFHEDLTEVMAEVLGKLGVQRAMVVHGKDGLDEISITCDTKVTELKDGKIKSYYIRPEDFGIERSSLDNIKGGDSKVNAEIIRNVLRGKKGAKRDVLLLNSGAGLYVVGKVDSVKAGVQLASEIIDSGMAYEKLLEYASYTKEF